MLTRNGNLCRDIKNKTDLRKSMPEPSDFVNGVHIDEIREQARHLKQFEATHALNKQSLQDISSPPVATAPPTFMTPLSGYSSFSPKALSRSYRNGLDTEYVKKTVIDAASKDTDERKPEYDWLKAVRQECIRRMKKCNKCEKMKIKNLFQIVGRQHPFDKFNDVKNIWTDSKEMCLPVDEIVDMMIEFVCENDADEQV